jgi:aldose 1-epimerase
MEGHTLKHTEFGKTKNGEEISLFTLKNKNGLEMVVSNLGASIVKLLVPDQNGKLRDIVLGFDSVEKYEKDTTHIGETVGRFANRIGGGSFELNGKLYNLAKNDHGNTLHGGTDLYGKRKWEVKVLGEQSIAMTLFSPDGDQGFPGNLEVELTYVLTDQNALEIYYQMTSDQDTYVNMTNHSFFNLNGHESGDILGHEVQILADAYTEANAESIPTGVIMPVEGTPMDFRTFCKIGERIDADYTALKFGRGYDHNWCLNQEFPGQFRKVAEVCGDESKIRMEVLTDMPGMQMYTGNFLDEEPGKDGVTYHARQAVCFETQYYPDAVHHDHFEKPLVKAGETKRSRTVYQFK